MQAGAEDLHRFAEAFIDPTALQGHFMHTGQRPTDHQHHQQHRKKCAAHVGKGPDLTQVNAEAVVQLVLQRQQRLWRPAQQTRDKTLRHQAGFKMRLARAE